jgi:arylsulfatase
MRISLVLAGLCSLLIPLSSRAGDRATTQPAPRPNIVLILADDMGYSDIGCYGGEISTPNIDSLARDGVRLTNFYNQARCCPSRAALMTGRYPHQVGIGAMIDGYAKWIREAAATVAPSTQSTELSPQHSDLETNPSYQDHLSPDSPTIAELLRTAGYHTMMCGKWHLGYRPTEWPVKRGFDRSFALIGGAMNYYGGGTKGPRTPMALDDQPYRPPHDGFYSTDAFTDHAIEFLKEAAQKDKDKPFFLYLAYNAAHWPLQAPQEDIDEYLGRYDQGWQPTREARYKRMVQMGILPQGTGMAPMDRGKVKPWNELTEPQRKQWALRMSIYAAQVTHMDRGIGKVLKTLDELHDRDNTLVLFLSDNGGAAEDPHHPLKGAKLGSRDSFWGYDRPWATVSNTPWRLHKTTAYEGGISTPLIARWPAGIDKQAIGTFVRQPGHIIDLMPTFLHLAGTTYPSTDTRHPEGQNILPMLQGQSGNPDRTFFWEHEGNRAIHKGDWKLVMLGNSPDGWELYNMKTDRIESHNLASKMPDKVKELTADYNAWAKRCGVVPWPEIEKHRPKPKP